MTVTLENKWRGYVAKASVGVDCSSLEFSIEWEEQTGDNKWLLESDKGGSPGVEELSEHLRLVSFDPYFKERTQNLLMTVLSVYEAGLNSQDKSEEAIL